MYWNVFLQYVNTYWLHRQPWKSGYPITRYARWHWWVCLPSLHFTLKYYWHRETEMTSFYKPANRNCKTATHTCDIEVPHHQSPSPSNDSTWSQLYHHQITTARALENDSYIPVIYRRAGKIWVCCKHVSLCVLSKACTDMCACEAEDVTCLNWVFHSKDESDEDIKDDCSQTKYCNYMMTYIVPEMNILPKL